LKNLRDSERKRLALENHRIQQSRERNQKTMENYRKIVERKNEIDSEKDIRNINNLEKEMSYLRNTVEKDINISQLKQTVV